MWSSRPLPLSMVELVQRESAHIEGCQRTDYNMFAMKTSYSPLFTYPNLGCIHEEVEQVSEEPLAEELGRCKLAQGNSASPVIKGTISKFVNGKKGSEESMIADSGCSFPVVSDKIV